MDIAPFSRWNSHATMDGIEMLELLGLMNFRLSRLTIIFCVLLPSAAWADGPSFDCNRASTSIERRICGSRLLSDLDQEMASLYFSIREQKSGNDANNFIQGARAWSRLRNSACGTGNSIDQNCLVSLYRDRIASLRATLRPQQSNFELVRSQRWINLASRADSREAIALSNEYQRLAGDRYDFKVFLAQNGWYAIVAGPVELSRSEGVIFELSRRIPRFDPDTYLTSGNRYHNLVYHSRSQTDFAYEARRTPTSNTDQALGTRSSNCSPASVRDRQAMCYVIAVGEYGCAEGLEEVSGYNGGQFLGEVSAAVACNIAISKMSRNELNPDMLVASALIGGLDSLGESLTSDGHEILGGLTRLLAFGSKIGVAESCAQQEARNCGY